MSTYKRRIVYLSDDEWTATIEVAKRQGVTASEVVRDCLRRGHLSEYLPDKTLSPIARAVAGHYLEPAEASLVVEVPRGWTPAYAPHASQAQRDAILRKINRG